MTEPSGAAWPGYTGHTDHPTTELYLSAGLALPLALFYTMFAVVNLFGEFLGTHGRMFLFEMDEVMGGLLGLPHYSKIEGVILLLAAVGGFACWSPGLDLGLVAVLGLLFGAVYLLICTAYGVHARQSPLLFLVCLAYNLVLLIWRSVSFLHSDFHEAVIVCGVVGFVLSLLSYFQMRKRRERLEPMVVRLEKLQKGAGDQFL
jgi:hypothetical protein